MTSVRFTSWLIIGLGLVCSGCSDRLPTYSVQGKVHFPDGSPVHVGTVELKSREHTDIQARGKINTDGTFTLSTYRDGDGAIEGTHDCVVVQLVMTEDISSHKPSRIGVIDRRYSSYATSGLSVEIKPNDKNDVQIEVLGVLKSQPEDHKH